MSHLIVFIFGFVAGSTAYYVYTHAEAQAKIAKAWLWLVSKAKRK